MKQKKHYYLYSELAPDGILEHQDKNKWIDKNIKTLIRSQEKPFLPFTQKNEKIFELRLDDFDEA